MIPIARCMFIAGILAAAGCSRSVDAELAKVRAETAKARAEAAEPKAAGTEPAKSKPAKADGTKEKVAGAEKPPAPNLRGRRLLAAEETRQVPYCYVGRVVTDRYPDAIGGTAVLVGRRHIVTAAHVIQDADVLAGKDPILFVLPDRRHSEIVSAELDGGYRKTRLTSYDLGICTLKDPLGAGGHAAWGVFEDADFGKTMMLAGFDHDLAGSTRPPPMVVRSGRISSHKGGYVIAALGAATLLDAASRRKIPQALFGADLALNGLILQDRLSNGWKSGVCVAKGASGGPLFLDREGVPTVVAVLSYAFDADKDRAGEFCLGSRISPGAAEAMVRDHIARNP